MSIQKLTKSDIKTIMELSELACYHAWNHGHKAGDEGAQRARNPFTPSAQASENLITLLSKALEK